MVVVILVSMLAVMLTYLSSYSKRYQRPVFALAFFLVTILQVIHYDYGTDYMGYLADHMLYNKSWKRLLYLRRIGHGAFKDMGWVLIQRFFPGEYGFFLFVGIISIIQNYIYYVLIKNYVGRKDRWKAMAIYLFMTSCYVLNFSAIRQGFAVALCVGAILLASKNKLWLAIVITLVAASIHVSAIVFFAFFVFIKAKVKSWTAICCLFFFCSGGIVFEYNLVRRYICQGNGIFSSIK